MHVAQGQPNYAQPNQQPQQHAAAYEAAQQASAVQQPAPRAHDYHRQAQLLMPIPAPPVGEKTSYPSGNLAYPETGVQQATHVELPDAATQTAPAVVVREEQATPASVQHSRWHDAWGRLRVRPPTKIRAPTSHSRAQTGACEFRSADSGRLQAVERLNKVEDLQDRWSPEHDHDRRDHQQGERNSI